MTPRTGTSVAVLLGILLAGTPAAAQEDASDPPPRWVLGSSLLCQAGPESFTDRFEFPYAGRTGTIESRFDPKPAFGFDGSLGLRIWRRFGLGGGVSFYAPAEDLEAGGEFVARIPHPFGAGADREVSSAAGMRRRESGYHVNVLYFVRVGPKLQAVVGAGPTFFRANQSFVRQIVFSEDQPAAPSTVTLSAVHRRSVAASGAGLNASLDLVWSLADTFGVGGMVRYSRATLSFTPGGPTVDATVGGLQAGAGIRFLF